MRDNLKNLKWILWFVVIIFVLLIFVDWGTGRNRSRGLAGIAARIGDVSVSEAQFLKEMRNTEQRYRQVYGQQYDKIRDQLDLATITMQNLIDRELLKKEAERLGLGVTDQELLDKITSFQAFRREDGSFVGEQLYDRILRANQTSPEEFEGQLRHDVVLEKLHQAMQAGLVIPESDVEREYRRRNETASFDALFVPAERALDRVTASDADAKAFYEANKARFTHPEQRQLRYLLVDASQLRRAVTVPETQIAEYYRTHLTEYQKPERANAQHILIQAKTSDPTGQQAAEQTAREVLAKARGGGDFAALAKQYSQDPGSKDKGGDLGWFNRGAMVKEFDGAVFALNPGEIGGPVKSQFGYHVIKVNARQPAGVSTLDEVRDTVRFKLADGLADAEGSRRATALKEKIEAAKLSTDEQWRALAVDGVTSNVTPFFNQGEAIPGLGRDPELMSEVTKAAEGFVGGPRRTDRGWVVYRLVKIRTAGTTAFEDAKDEARDGAKRTKAVEQLRQELEGKRGALAAAPLQGQETALGGTFRAVPDHRRGTAVPGIGVSQPLEDAVFAALPSALTPVVAISDRGVVIARVTAKKAMDPAAFAKEKDSLRASMAQDELQKLLSSLLAEAKRANPVTINQELVDRFKPRRG